MISDFVVAGAGIAGLTTARELAKRGAQVAVLDKGAAGGEASWASAGILAALPPWDCSPALAQLANASACIYPALIQELIAKTGIDPEYEQSGALVLPPYDEGKALAWRRENLIQIEKVFAREREPALQTSAEALSLSCVAQVRSPRLLQALGVNALQRGIKIVEHTEVLGLNIARGHVRSIATSTGEINAGAVIICAGAWSQKLLGEFAGGLKIEPVKGQMLLFKREPGLLKSVVLQKDSYLVPRRDGHVLAGSSLEHSGFDKTITAAFKEQMLQWARELISSLNEESLAGQWAGLRPQSVAPVIASHPGIENLFVNSGHFRYGLTIAPASAAHIAKLIFGEEPSSAFSWPSKQPPEARVLS